MKKKSLKKLSFNRETIVNLNTEDMGNLNGGALGINPWTDFYWCGTRTSCTDPADCASGEQFMCTADSRC